MQVSYYDPEHGFSGDEFDGNEPAAIVTGLAPNEPVFVFRARDIAFPAAFAGWWAEVADTLTPERGAQAKATAKELSTWAEQNPEQARLPD